MSKSTLCVHNEQSFPTVAHSLFDKIENNYCILEWKNVLCFDVIFCVLRFVYKSQSLFHSFSIHATIWFSGSCMIFELLKYLHWLYKVSSEYVYIVHPRIDWYQKSVLHMCECTCVCVWENVFMSMHCRVDCLQRQAFIFSVQNEMYQ